MTILAGQDEDEDEDEDEEDEDEEDEDEDEEDDLVKEEAEKERIRKISELLGFRMPVGDDDDEEEEEGEDEQGHQGDYCLAGEIDDEMADLVGRFTADLGLPSPHCTEQLLYDPSLPAQSVEEEVGGDFFAATPPWGREGGRGSYEFNEYDMPCRRVKGRGIVSLREAEKLRGLQQREAEDAEEKKEEEEEEKEEEEEVEDPTFLGWHDRDLFEFEFDPNVETDGEGTDEGF